MIKILLANENVDQSEIYCKHLCANDKNLEIIRTYNGISTLKTYINIRPNIFVLDTHFSDINGIEIIDKLSMSLDEKRNCNTIVTTNSTEEQLRLLHTSKVYEIIPNPYTPELLQKAIYNMYFENKYEQLERDDIQVFLLKIGLSLCSDSADYLVDAIMLCYYFPYYLKNLDSVLDYVATKYNKNRETIRNGIRSVLKPLTLYNSSTHPILKYFEYSKGITPKKFIEVAVIYLHRKKTFNKT